MEQYDAKDASINNLLKLLIRFDRAKHDPEMVNEKDMRVLSSLGLG